MILATERLPARIGADIFNLITIGDGVVGGSATVRYDLVNQGVQEFHVKAPANWKNIEFTGLNIRSREQAGETWTIHLQEKAWDGYTLVVTYDKQFDAANATLDASGLHAPEAEHETGSVAITTAASLKVQAGPVAEPLRVIDRTELAEGDRALITRPVLLAYRYTGHSYSLKLTVARQQEEAVLDAVADRTELTSVLTDAGEMLTQASFMVKNNGKQFQRFQLPAGADFWGCSVDGTTSKAGKDNDWWLVPLPERADRDQAFAVDIVYAQNAGPVKSRWSPAAWRWKPPNGPAQHLRRVAAFRAGDSPPLLIWGHHDGRAGHDLQAARRPERLLDSTPYFGRNIPGVLWTGVTCLVIVLVLAGAKPAGCGG